MDELGQRNDDERDLEDSALKEVEIELAEEIIKYRQLTKQKFELERQIDMEFDLGQSLLGENDNNINNVNYGYNWSEIVQKQLKSFSEENNSASLLDEIEYLKENLEKLKRKKSLMNENENCPMKSSENVITYGDSSILSAIDKIKNEILILDSEVNTLLNQIITFDDDDLHELRAKKQHFDIIKRK